jgi:hypothetical protein
VEVSAKSQRFPRTFRSAAYFLFCSAVPFCYIFTLTRPRESDVGLTLNLNMLAVLAAFAFVTAILLGAF